MSVLSHPSPYLATRFLIKPPISLLCLFYVEEGWKQMRMRRNKRIKEERRRGVEKERSRKGDKSRRGGEEK
jgi:hypothetical protein